MKIEPRPYRLQIDLNPQKSSSIDSLCDQLSIQPENTERIKEDDWGVRGHIEIWFQDIAEQHLIIHIQRKRSALKKKYLEQLKKLFNEFDRNECIRSYKDIGY